MDLHGTHFGMEDPETPPVVDTATKWMLDTQDELQKQGQEVCDKIKKLDAERTELAALLQQVNGALQVCAGFLSREQGK